MKKSLGIVSTDKENLHLVAYTDGGCNPNPGPGGWGVYGKVFIVPSNIKYSPPSAKKTTGTFSPVDEDTQKAFTHVEFDGRGGWSVTTNNIMEMNAVIHTLEFAIHNNVQSIMIFSDSMLTLDGMAKYLPKWKANNWLKQDGTEPKNLIYWKKIDILISKIIESKIIFKTQWVKAHAGMAGNEKADVLATKGINDARAGDDKITFNILANRGIVNIANVDTPVVKVPKWKANRMIPYPKWFFVSNIPLPKDKQGRQVYYTGTHGKDKDLDLIGKHISDAGFAVSYVTRPEEPLDEIREYQNTRVIRKYNYFCIAKLDNILSGQGGTEFATDKFKYIVPATKYNIDITTLSGRSYTAVLDPPRKALNMFTGFDRMRDRLDMFISGSNAMVKTNVTGEFFQVNTNAKGKVTYTLINIESNTKAVNVKSKYNIGGKIADIDITLVPGQDMPTRNILSSITNRLPQVYVITWEESPACIRFATIVECDTDIAIWSSLYANILTI